MIHNYGTRSFCTIIYKSYLRITLQKLIYKPTIQMHTYFGEITEE